MKEIFSMTAKMKSFSEDGKGVETIKL